MSGFDQLNLIDYENSEFLQQEQQQIENDMKNKYSYFDKNLNSNINQESLKTFQTQLCQEFTEAIHDDLVNFGQPTIIKKYKNFIVIGTSCGMVILYDIKSKFSSSILLIKEKYKNKNGAITALDISYDGKIMAVGYTNGYIDLIEIETQYKFETYKDIHHDVILKLKFVHEYFNSLQNCELLSTDAKGYVYRIQIKVTTHFGRLFTTPNIIPLIEYGTKESLGLMVGQNEQDVCIDISLLSSGFAKTHLKTKTKLVSLVFQECGIFIIKLDYESASIVKQITKPDFIEASNPPIVSWGEAGFYSTSSSFAVLLVGWGSYLFLTKLQYFDGEINFINASSAYLGDEIQFCGFISNSIILAVFGTKIAIIHSYDFVLGFVQQIDPVFSIQGFQMLSPLDFEMEEIFTLGCKNNYRFFSCSFKQNELYFIHKNKVFYSKLISWEEFFNKKSKNGDWLSAMKLAMMVDKGQIQYLGGIDCNPQRRKQIMKTYFQELSINFVASKLTDGKKTENGG